MNHTGTLDPRFGEAPEPTPWTRVASALADASVYQFVTVRADGRPHVTPLVGLWLDEGFVLCTGPAEQKARNLERNPRAAVTVAAEEWDAGLDVVVEGTARRVTGGAELRRVADAYRAKYDGAWDFDHDDEVFDPGGQRAPVFRVEPDKVIAFAKSPHAQTTFRR